MNKRKGFTLIELLAVIVILAIIALIATPIVMNVIEKSKKGAAERSAENYIDAVETKVVAERINGNILEGEYTIGEDGNLCPSGKTCTDETEIKIEMSGNKPTGGTIKIENGKVLTASTMNVGEYTVAYNEEKKAYVATKVNAGQEGKNEVLCTAATSKVRALVYDGKNYPLNESSYTRQEVGLLATDTGNTPYTPGVAYICNLGNGEETFYILEENVDNVTLLLGRNIGATVAWCGDQSLCKVNGTWDNSAGPITATAALKERTVGWTKLTEDQITLPSGQQIATAGGDTEWTASNNSSNITLPTWLRSSTNFTDGTHAGYWTSTPYGPYYIMAWTADSTGHISMGEIHFTSDYGVRPVITISKSKLSS